MKYIATCGCYVGIGDSLEEAWDELKENNSDADEIGECEFYEATQISVDLKVVKKEVPVRSKCK